MNKGILEQLIQEIKAQGDLPALSVNIKKMLAQLNKSDMVEASLDELIPMVASDIGLTKSVFSLVNSAMYSVYGREVKTLSKALLILGTDALTHLAIRQRVAESVLDPKKSGSQEALKCLAQCVHASYLGRELAVKTGHQNPDMLSLHCLLSGIGRLLVATYLPQEYEQLGLHPEMLMRDADLCCEARHKMSFTQIGRALCSTWGVPTNTNPDESEFVEQVSEISMACVNSNTQGLIGLQASLADSLGIALEEMHELVRETAKGSDDLLHESGLSAVHMAQAVIEPEKLVRELESSCHTASLSSLIGQSTEVLRTILGADNACTFLYVASEARFSAKFCLGQDATLHRQMLEFDTGLKGDLFSLSVRQERPFYVSDIRVTGIREKLPAWFLTTLYEKASSLMMVPVWVKGRCIVAFYLDWQIKPNDQIPPEHQKVILRVVDGLKSKIEQRI